MRSRRPSAAGRRKGPEAVTEQKTGYITADTLPSKVVICTLAAEVRRNYSTIRAGMSAARRAQFATVVARRKALGRRLHRTRGQVGKASRISSMKAHEYASGQVDESLAECLVRPEAHDGQTEGVHGKLIVFHILAKDIGDAGCPSLPLEFRMIRGVGVHLLELDARRIRRLSQVVKDDVLNLHIDIRQAAVFDVILNAVVLALLVDHGALHVAIEEIKGL